MNIIGVIAEYNPFHNGHLYHIKKIKELYPDSLIIAVVSGYFCQRGELSILTKKDKTKIALNNDIDIVVELPFVFGTQSADIFAKGAIQILNELKVDTIIFGSECNDIKKLEELAKKQLDKEYNQLVKENLSKGLNYPTALAKALNTDINTPNDLLAISYIKQIITNNYNIKYQSIKRTNDYHDKELNNTIISASAIRANLSKDIKPFLPQESYDLLKDINHDNLFRILKYKIISDKDLSIYQTVDEGIENRIKKAINKSNNLEELVNLIKTKRYTYNKINRMLIHILCSFTKEDAKACQNNEYIKILGFNQTGKKHLNNIKKDSTIPIITSYKFNSRLIDIEYRTAQIYQIINNNFNIKEELEKPIIK